MALKRFTDDIIVWAPYCIKGKPKPFILSTCTHWTREGVMEDIGKTWKRRNETAKEGWKHAYAAGWRAIKVTLTAVNPLPK